MQILAIKNGVTKKFTEMDWRLMPPHKYGWVKVPEEIATNYDNNKAQKDGESGGADGGAVQYTDGRNRYFGGVHGHSGSGRKNTEAEAETGAGNIDAGAGKRRGRKRKH